MSYEKTPYPWEAVKGGAIGEVIDRMKARLAEMEEESQREEELIGPEHSNYGMRIITKEWKMKKVQFFEQYQDKVEVLDDNRLRFNGGVIYPKSFKVKFDGSKTIYTYKRATMKAFMDNLPALR